MQRSIMVLILGLLLPTGAALAGPSAFVTIAPQKYFVDRISGGKATVSVMVEPGANPHAYEPKPRQMAALAGASIYFTIGDSFDQTWLERIASANPEMTIVHTAEGIKKIPMTGAHDHEEHAHPGETHDGKGHGHADKDETHQNGGDAHEHGTLDPHVWLDPALVKVQAAHIRDGLSRVDPQNAGTYAANAAVFMQELDALDLEIRSSLSALPENQRTFLVFHPSWGYFARAYGLSQASIEVEGKEPSPRDMARIIAMGQETGARVVFVQPQFSEKSASVIARQIGAKVVRLDPLAADWSENLRKAAHAFVDALK